MYALFSKVCGSHRIMNMKKIIALLSVLFFTGCTTFAIINFADLYGNSSPRERVVETLPAGHVDYWNDVKPIIDNRCVVCHGCYDAPCQLKMGSIEGMVRGASRDQVYDLARLTTAEPSRLFEDAKNVFEWRQKGFFPVLNERNESPMANREASLMYKMLQLKDHNPLPEDKILGEAFDLSLDREQYCPKDNEFQRYAIDFPLGGMPYALPGLETNESSIIRNWVEQGGNYTERPHLGKKHLDKIALWEAWLNNDSLEQQLTSRYIYEHLFVSHLYFSEIENNNAEVQYFDLVRSATPPGQPIEHIASRRPFDDPMVNRVYYRLLSNKATIIAKTHMPYALNKQRMTRWKELFNPSQFAVNDLPNYSKKIASNPFLAFADLPVSSRYKFMLDEAQSTIMGFIKGPVCRGQVALNVINDNFWVYFIDPELAKDHLTAEYLEKNGRKLELPAIYESTVFRPLSHWKRYASMQKALLSERETYLKEHLNESQVIDLNVIWNGGGTNPNAGLTIMRHFDSATVEKGLIGTPPKTAWVIGYTLLERIHYLLVAGYDVYGNAGHQFVTRTYMDFLRMEGESNFLLFLPPKERKEIRDYWYRNAEDEVEEYMTMPAFENGHKPNIDYRTDDKQQELYQLLAKRLAPALNQVTNKPSTDFEILSKLNNLPFSAIDQLPQATIIQIEQSDSYSYYTLVRNDAHLNMTSMFGESANRIPEEDTAMILQGVVGAYPNAFYRLKQHHLTEFVHTLSNVNTAEAYSKFLDSYGVRRTNPDFWTFSDQLMSDYKNANPIEAGLLDYNRLENR